MFVKSLYPPEEAATATSWCSYLMLASNIIVIPLAIWLGHIGDKVKVWKLMIIFGSISGLFFTLMVVDTANKIIVYIGFVGSTSFIITVLLLVSIFL